MVWRVLREMPSSASLRGATRIVLVTALLLGSICAAWAGPREYPHHPVNLSLFYPISTNRDPDLSTNFRPNLIYSKIGAVRGLDLNGVVGSVRRDMVGFQVNGIYSHISGEFRGVGVSGVASYVKSNAVGFQFAGLVNFVRADFSGFQFANIMNYVEGEMTGVQATALFNLNDGNVRYFQYSSIANAVAGDVTGVQAAAGLNYVNESMVGGQLALANFAKNMTGVQIGLGNVAGDAWGVQVGFVNFSTRLDGVPLGMINYVRDGGDSDWITYASNIAAVSTGVRTIDRRLYSFFAIGVDDLQEDRSGTAFLSWHYGYAVPIAARWKIGGDLGYVHIMPQSSSDPEVNTRAHFAVQGRIVLEVELREKFKLFGGGGVSQRNSAYSSDNMSSTDPLVVLGISLY